MHRRKGRGRGQAGLAPAGEFFALMGPRCVLPLLSGMNFEV